MLALSSVAALAAAPNKVLQPALAFEFRSSFWINLHHRMFMQAQALAAQKTRPLHPGGSSWNALAFNSLHEMQLNADQQNQWNAALAGYAPYTDFDLLDAPMSQIADALAIPDGTQPSAGGALRRGLVQALAAAAPIYREAQWPADDRINREWIAQVAPRVAVASAAMSTSLRQAYGDPFPIGPFRVDVTSYANWAGCYTNTDPVHIFISPRDMRNAVSRNPIANRGDLAVEMVFHEAGHSVVTPGYGQIGREIENAVTQRRTAEPEGLWHAFIFYTTGAIARKHFAGQSYVMAADLLSLWSGSWKRYGGALARHWQPFLDGGGSRAGAIDAVVDSLVT